MASEEKEGSKSSSLAQAIDNSVSLEIDQQIESSLSLEKKVDEDSEVGVGFLARSKKLLSSLWEKISGFKRAVQGKPFRLCLGDGVERTRVYHFWPGNNVFFFGGRLICGPDPKGLILTAIAISLSSWTFAVHVASDIRNPAIIITSSILTTIVLMNLVFVSTSDPGIIPRNDQCSSVELGAIDAGKRKRGSRVVVINGIEVKLKYCNICNIYRPPRTCHCATCNNCIQQFDHHCPWIGHCVGLRNYRLDVTFLFTGLLLFAFIFIFSCKSLLHKLPGDGNGVIGLLKHDLETVALTLFSFVAVCFLAGLSCYHVYLIAINQNRLIGMLAIVLWIVITPICSPNMKCAFMGKFLWHFHLMQTTYEHFRQKYVSSGNPYDKGILNNIKEFLLASQSPSRVNFRADVEPGWFVG